MKDFRKDFDEVRTIFEGTNMWRTMGKTVEDSPWHREANVAVHTEMVVAEYIKRSPEVWDRYDFAGAIACLFHDVGKPVCKVQKFKPERGYYFAFHGHEKVSSREFVNFVMSTNDVRKFFDEDTLFIAAWMIEYHLPWDIKDKKKREMLLRTCHKFLGGSVDVFTRVVLADTYGRISDDAETKRAKSDEWVATFKSDFEAIVAYFDYLTSSETEPTAYVFIGASGSGKSTFRKTLENADVFSLDDLRIEMYGDDCSVAFQKSCDDNHFKPKAKDRFLEMARKNKVLIVDNVHATKKSRIMYADELQRRGYKTQAVLFVTSRDTVIKRQKTRGDKEVPAEAVIRQFDSVELPSLGEFDFIRVVFGE